MPITPSLVTYNVPGVYVTENTYGSVPAVISSFNTVYVLGSSNQAGAPVNVPTYCANLNDFTNVFGASPSSAAIQSFFDQRSGYGLYFINVGTRVERTVTATTFTAGTVLTLTIDGYAINYTCVTGDTATTARDKLGALVNTQLPSKASYYAAAGVVRCAPAITVTGSAGLTLGTATTITTVQPRDVADSLNLAFQPDLPQGFICAPEFYQAFTNLSDRTYLQGVLEAFASDPNYYWVSVVDPGLATATATTGGTAINLAIAERATFISPKGHSWYFFPYLYNATNTLIPPSLAFLGVALRKARNEGFAVPRAGVPYPVYGVIDLSFPITDQIQSQLNPLGINCIRKLNRGRGICVYGARTLSTSSFYTFESVRLVLNVLAGSFKAAFDSFPFSLVDGQGILFGRIKQTAIAYCEQLRLGGALFGATGSDAYLVICDLTNNTADKLEAGQLTLDVIVKPSPTAEVIVVNLNRASLGTVLAEVAGSGDTSKVVNLGTQGTTKLA